MRRSVKFSACLIAMLTASQVAAKETYDWSYPPMWYFLSQWWLSPLVVLCFALLFLMLIRSVD